MNLLLQPPTNHLALWFRVLFINTDLENMGNRCRTRSVAAVGGLTLELKESPAPVPGLEAHIDQGLPQPEVLHRTALASSSD